MAPFYADPPDAPWALLARHLAAEATATERAKLRAWVQAEPAHLQILTTVTRAWERAGEAMNERPLFSAADVEAAWQRFRPLLQPAPTPTLSPPLPVVRLLWPGTAGQLVLLRVAALLTLALGVGYLLAPRAPGPPSAAAGSCVSTATRRFVRLPDGSGAWLNARSRLQYAGFGPGSGRRAVQLIGEAYFEVAPDPTRPFVVSTSTARVRVTGTAFNVRAYAAEDSVEVNVVHGRVWAVRLAGADSVLLSAATRVAWRAADAPGRAQYAVGPLRGGPATNNNFRAWQTDTLRFAEAPLPEVVRSLQAAFGTSVVLRNPVLRQCRFTGVFARPRPEQVLAVLAAATGSRLSAEGHGGFVLQGVGCGWPLNHRADSTASVPVP